MNELFLISCGLITAEKLQQMDEEMRIWCNRQNIRRRILWTRFQTSTNSAGSITTNHKWIYCWSIWATSSANTRSSNALEMELKIRWRKANNDTYNSFSGNLCWCQLHYDDKPTEERDVFNMLRRKSYYFTMFSYSLELELSYLQY